MKIIDRISKWPSENKKIFSLIVAVFLTILIIILWFTVDFYFKKDNIEDTTSSDNLSEVKESFKDIFKDLNTNISTTSENNINASTSLIE
ncbi:MAG: hypothetical protein WCG60_01680 [bacterium]